MKQKTCHFIKYEEGFSFLMPRTRPRIFKTAYSPDITLPKNIAPTDLQSLPSSFIILAMMTIAVEAWWQKTLALRSFQSAQETNMRREAKALHALSFFCWKYALEAIILIMILSYVMNI